MRGHTGEIVAAVKEQVEMNADPQCFLAKLLENSHSNKILSGENEKEKLPRF